MSEAGRLFGPGVYDMKASLVMLFAALESCGRLGFKSPRPVTVLATSDEEIGSPSSRSLIEALARDCAYVLVLEPPLADGGLKTAQGCRSVHHRDRGQGRSLGSGTGQRSQRDPRACSSDHEDPCAQ